MKNKKDLVVKSFFKAKFKPILNFKEIINK